MENFIGYPDEPMDSLNETKGTNITETIRSIQGAKSHLHRPKTLNDLNLIEEDWKEVSILR